MQILLGYIPVINQLVCFFPESVSQYVTVTFLLLFFPLNCASEDINDWSEEKE